MADFFRDNRKKLEAYTRKRLSDLSHADAEDLVQDVLVSLWNTIHAVDTIDFDQPIRNIGAYVYRAIRNRIIDRHRKKKTEPLSFDSAFDAEGEMSRIGIADFAADYRYEAQADAEKRWIRNRVFESIDRLNPDQKAVWMATEMDGFTFQELSLLWDVPLGTLLARKHRANRNLREMLQDLQEETNES